MQRNVSNRVSRFNFSQDEQEVYWTLVQILSQFEEGAMFEISDSLVKDASEL